MTNKSIFEYIDYKAYLSALEHHGNYKGFRSRLAESTGCQNAFISQVLNGHVNFNLEQALRLKQLLRLNDEEHQYFLWMVEHKRAGTQELKKYFHNLMILLREKNLEIKSRVQINPVLSQEAQTTYYSSWVYAAIHIAVMIPNLNSIQKISDALNIDALRIKKATDFLVDHGLLEQKGNSLKSGRTQIHLGNDSANINKHHTNWRVESLKSLDSPQAGDLHYSGVSSLSKADADKLRSQFVSLIENYVRQIEVSPEETLYTFNLDFFKILKDENKD